MCTSLSLARDCVSPPNPSFKEGVQKYIAPAVCAKREACGTLAANGYADKPSCINTIVDQATRLIADDSAKNKCSAATLQTCADQYPNVACAADARSDPKASAECVPCGFSGG